MPDDKALTLRQADSLYQGFPDFADWPAPTEDDLDLWDRFAYRLKEMREQATPEALRKSVEVAVRAAAMDTGAIEGLYTVDRGFTMTVATQAIAWEHALDEKGDNVRALFEAQLEAYELVIDAVTKKLPITEAWIRALHEKVCAGQQTYRVWTDQGWQEQELSRGAYKSHPNHVHLAGGAIHPYAPVDRVPAEMYRLLEQIRTPEFESAHPIAQASYLHYGFVVIHPFADGNGRVARALASVFFYRALSIPFLVFANQRTAYFDALHQADLGQTWPLLAFFRDRGIDTNQLVAEQVLTAQSPVPEEIALGLSKTRRIPVKDLENTAQRLLYSAANHLQRQIEGIRLPDHLQASVLRNRRHWMAHSGYSPLDSEHIEVQLSEHRLPSRPLLVRAAKVLVAVDDKNPFTFLLDLEGIDDRLEVRLEDVYPEISENLQLRLSNWARRILGRLLNEWQGRNPASA
jgi:Fic family protein